VNTPVDNDFASRFKLAAHVKIGARLVIDTAPLLASPQPTGTLRAGEVLEVHGGMMYFAPDGGSPLWVSLGWVRAVEGSL
jgi:hypothetical protein